jgi:hypothetical protein
MERRHFLLAAGATALASGASAETTTDATILYEGRSVHLTNARADSKDLWIQTRDLPQVNEFEVKPQGACRGDVCIPISKDLKSGNNFNLTGFARRVRQSYLADSGVWSFGAIPVMRGAYLQGRMAPDFAVPDRVGKIVHLSDFRGKKVLLVTWASW